LKTNPNGAIMAAVTKSDLEALLAQFQGDGLMLSCYADLSIERGCQSRWLGPFKTNAGALKKALASDHRAWDACTRDLEAIRRAIEAPAARQARGMAVFNASQRGFFRAIPLDLSVANELVVHRAPYLVPLLAVFYRQREFLVVHTDSHRGRLYAASWTGSRLLQEIQEIIPRKQHSVGTRWGKEQATIARHRDDLIHRFQKQLVHGMEKEWTAHRYRGLVLLGLREVVERLRKQLPPPLATRVICEAPHVWTDRPLAANGAIHDVLVDALRAYERQMLLAVKERLQQRYGIACGPKQVIAALQNGRIGPRGFGYLVLGPDPREAVARCTACRFISDEMPTTCPRCQRPCVEANLWEELILLALRHDIDVHFVDADPELERCGRLVAVLGKTASPEPIRL
jgi:hypothetical protein